MDFRAATRPKLAHVEEQIEATAKRFSDQEPERRGWRYRPIKFVGSSFDGVDGFGEECDSAKHRRQNE